ncbi:MAG: hypothetical protein ACD_39C01822G0002 [uncultured bacterium]|nr:MAG: hypothetical protein ACD_39C01822G0002 [uncultured bacterium]
MVSFKIGEIGIGQIGNHVLHEQVAFAGFNDEACGASEIADRCSVFTVAIIGHGYHAAISKSKRNNCAGNNIGSYLSSDSGSQVAKNVATNGGWLFNDSFNNCCTCHIIVIVVS